MIAETVNSIVSRRCFTVGIVDDAGVVEMRVVFALNWDRASADPCVVAHCRRADCILNGTVVEAFRDRKKRLIVACDAGKVLRQNNELRAGISGGADQLQRVEDIFFRVEAGNHLTSGNAHSSSSSLIGKRRRQQSASDARCGKVLQF